MLGTLFFSLYGPEPWVSKAVAQLGLENTIRNPWPPKRVPDTVPVKKWYSAIKYKGKIT